MVTLAGNTHFPAYPIFFLAKLIEVNVVGLQGLGYVHLPPSAR